MNVRTELMLPGISLSLALGCGGGGTPQTDATLPPFTAPYFTIQPTSQLVTANDTVTFSVGAYGYPAPTFVWETCPKDGNVWTPIAGATSAILTGFKATVGLEGTLYHAIATVTQGAETASVTSNAATLTVLTAPSILSFRAEPALIHPGDGTFLKWATQNASNVALDQNAPSLQPGQVSVWVKPAVTTTYTLTVNNANGTPTTATATVTVQSRSGTPAWKNEASLPTPRSNFSTTFIPDASIQGGRVLVAGGMDANSKDLKSAVIYDPSRNAWDPVTDMPEPRSSHAAVLLADGRVLVVVGGQMGP